MSVPVICRACGTRLKLPPGFAGKKAKCPKCDARVDVTAALDATAYLPTPANESIPDTPRPSALPAKSPPPTPTTRAEREEDPLPYVDLNPARPATRPIPPAPPTEEHKKPAGGAPPLSSHPAGPLPLDDVPLSLDDDPPANKPPATPAGPPPLRVPVRVIADSAKQFTGPCDAVLTAHGLFLESIPYRPFLYVPIRSRADVSGRRGLEVLLPDNRKVTFEFNGRNGRQLADDVAAFLAGERGVPDAREYRRSHGWLLWVALILALGLSAGPIVLSRTANLGHEMGLMIGAGFAGAGLLANGAVVLLMRVSVAGKVALMALIGLLVTGVFLFGATAYLAGRRDEADQARPEPPEPPPPKPPDPVPVPVDPPAPRLPSAIDVAYKEGVYRFEDGPDDVTSLAVGAGWSALVIGYKTGLTRVWMLDQPTLDPFNLGPKSDGPPTRIQFDGTGSIVYVTCPGGMVAALWNTPPEVPVKIPGDAIAPFAAPGGERFAVLRANTLSIRSIPTAMIQKPVPGKVKGFLLTKPADEPIPNDAKAPLAPPPARPTFFAWHPTGKLLGGLPDGSILSWGATGPGSTIITREHKGAVRAWATSQSTWDFATGDDRGSIGVWANKSMTPKTFIASPSAAITQLSFSPSGAHLASMDADGIVAVWDLAAHRAILKVRRPAAKAMTFGPTDDLLLLSDGKAVELWYVPELDRRP